MAVSVRFDLPPALALAFFRQKGLRTSFAWQDMLREEHTADFTVAKMADLDLLAEVAEIVDRALAEGITLREFIADLKPELMRRGWWGEAEMTDPETGETKRVQLGSPRRLRTIFRVNLRTAYAAGHWSRIQEHKAEAPYLLYDAVNDSRTRPAHHAMDGLVLPVDSPYWAIFYPPNGWNCRCACIQIDKRQLKRLGKDGPDEAPPIETRDWTNPRTGEIEQVPKGVDPGWDYNPGAARGAHLAEVFTAKVHAAAPTLGASAYAAAADVVTPQVDAGYRDWVDAIARGDVRGQGGRRDVGAIAPAILAALAARVDIVPATAALTIAQREVAHLLAQTRKGQKAMTPAQVRNLVQYLADPLAVIWDGAGRLPALLYVFRDEQDTDNRLGRIAVRVDFERRGNKLNAIRSGARVSAANLTRPGMIRLDDGKPL